MPQDIPPAIRSRCVEIFFRPLLPDEIANVALHAAKKINYILEPGALEVIKRFATNGREAVNIIQIAAGIVQSTGRGEQSISQADAEWVINFGQYSPRPEKKVPLNPQVGVVNGLAVYGSNIGMLMELEVTAVPNNYGTGKLTVTGVIEEEEMGSPGRTVRRKSMAKGSLDNVLTVLAKMFGIEYHRYDIHVNFPGGVPVDGPSAGVTVATAIYSAVNNIPIDNTVAMTGEISIRGLVKPVGGVSAKVAAAKQAGARRVIIPAENWQGLYKNMEIEVIPVETFEEVLKHAVIKTGEVLRQDVTVTMPEVLAAAGVDKV